VVAEAKAEIGEGKPLDAVPLLEKAMKMPDATSLYLPTMFKGDMSDATSFGESELRGYFAGSPTPLADEALFELSNAYAHANDYEKVRDTLLRLRDKYPDGNLVKQDADFFFLAAQKGPE